MFQQLQPPSPSFSGGTWAGGAPHSPLWYMFYQLQPLPPPPSPPVTAGRHLLRVPAVTVWKEHGQAEPCTVLYERETTSPNSQAVKLVVSMNYHGAIECSGSLIFIYFSCHSLSYLLARTRCEHKLRSLQESCMAPMICWSRGQCFPGK